LHLAALNGRFAAVCYLLSVAPLEVVLAVDADGASALQLAERNGHVETAETLRGPEEEHRRLVHKWSDMLRDARPEAHLPVHATQEGLAVDLASPQLQRVSKEILSLTCCVRDLEYRLLEYVIEIRHCDGGPQAAAPARVYYARLGEQRKVDEVAFRVPRRRPSGQTLWVLGGRYQFRIIGRCARCSWLPFAPWQIVSAWSEPELLTHVRGARRRSSPLRHTSRCRRRSNSSPPCRAISTKWC